VAHSHCENGGTFWDNPFNTVGSALGCGAHHGLHLPAPSLRHQLRNKAELTGPRAVPCPALILSVRLVRASWPMGVYRRPHRPTLRAHSRQAIARPGPAGRRPNRRRRRRPAGDAWPPPDTPEDQTGRFLSSRATQRDHRGVLRAPLGFHGRKHGERMTRRKPIIPPSPFRGLLVTRGAPEHLTQPDKRVVLENVLRSSPRCPWVMSPAWSSSTLES
jgi:hypothetical protein